MKSYLVAYVSSLEASQSFHSGLGFVLKSEQHGAGPKHYSFQNTDLVIKLYPAGDKPTSRIRNGIQAPITAQGSEKILIDPDGNKIKLLSQKIDRKA